MMTAAEVAERFRVTTRTVRRWNALKLIRGIRLLPGAPMRYLTSEIDALVAPPVKPEDTK